MAETKGIVSDSRDANDEKVAKMRLVLIDRETGESRYCTLEEAETWDWGNPDIWRLVSGWQITSFGGLLNMLYMKAEKDIQEVEILQSPRCMMLAGG